MLNLENYNIKIYQYNEVGYIKILDNKTNNDKKIKPLVMIKIDSFNNYNSLVEILKIIKNDNLNISNELIRATNSIKQNNQSLTFGLTDLLESSFEYNNDEKLNKNFEKIKLKKKIYKIENNKLIYYIKSSVNFVDNFYEELYEIFWIIKHIFYLSKKLILYFIINSVIIYFLPNIIITLIIKLFIIFILFFLFIYSILYLKTFNGYYIEMNYNYRDYIYLFKNENMFNINKKLKVYFEYLLTSKLRKKITPLCYEFRSLNNNNYEFYYYNKKKEVISQEIKILKNKIIIIENNNKTMIRFFILKVGKYNISIKVFNEKYNDCNDYADLINNFYFNTIKDKLNKEIINFINSKNNVSNKYITINSFDEIKNSIVLKRKSIVIDRNSLEYNKKNKDDNFKETNNDIECKLDINKIKTEANNLIDIFNNEIDEDYWKFSKKFKNCKIYYEDNKNESNFISKKFEMEYDCNFLKIFELYKNIDHEIKFNESYEDIKIKDKISDDLILIQVIIKKKFPINKREFICFDFIKEEENVAYLIRFKAPDYLVNESKDITRGEIKFEVKKFIKINENKTKYINISKIDSKLKLVPKYLIKKELNKLVDIPFKYNNLI